MIGSTSAHLARSTWAKARRVACGLTTARGRAAIRIGVVATVAPQSVLRRLSPQFVVDVGANRGQFALDVVRTCPGVPILAFEPLAAEADVFEQVMSGVSHVELIRCAIGAERTRAEMHVSQAADSSSLLPIAHHQEEMFPGTAEIGVEEVDVAPLIFHLPDEALPAGTLLKVDVQGAELDVIESAGHRLGEFAWLLIEVSFVKFYVGQPLAHECISRLATLGFGVADVVSTVRINGRTVQADLLFVQMPAS